MHHIHTSPEAVSKLKKAAKLLTRGDTLLQHAEALDRVAKKAGYLHWKHVTTCAEASAAQANSSPLASVTAAQCTDPRFGKPKDQELTLIVGPSGYGKTFRAIDYALNWLRQGKPVHVLGTSVPVHEIAPTALLVVDEVWQMPRVLGSPDALNQLVSAHLAAGGSAVLLQMDRILTNGPKPQLDIETGPAVRRSLIQLDRI